MATPETLKQRFADGKNPTGQDFAELIDTIQAGSQSEGTFAPVSEQVAIEGTDTLGALSPAGLTAHIEARLATKGEAEAGQAASTGDKERLMTPQRSAEAISYQATPLIRTAKNVLLGGVSSSYNTLKKLYDYLVGSFYTKTASDNRYDRKTDTIAGNRLQNYLRYPQHLPHTQPTCLQNYLWYAQQQPHTQPTCFQNHLRHAQHQPHTQPGRLHNYCRYA